MLRRLLTVLGYWVCLPVAVVYLSLWLPVPLTTEQRWQIASAVFEMAGFGTVAGVLLHKVDQVGGGPGLRERIRSWIHRIQCWIPWVQPERETVRKQWSEELEVSGDSRLDRWPGPETTLERQVQILEKQLRTLTSRIEDLRQECREARTELGQSIEQLRRYVDNVQDELRQRDRRLAVGALHWELRGLWWFLLGIIASNFANSLPWF